MKAELILSGKMQLNAQVGGYQISMDASPPIGEGTHPSPKQMLLVSMAGCSAMDVISLLRKHKQNFQNFKMSTQAESVKEYPQVFESDLMEYFVEGPVDATILNESIQKSLSKYCSVSAMVSKVVPIRWKAYINSQLVGEGKAEFTF